jgi:hypothetical protein
MVGRLVAAALVTASAGGAATTWIAGEVPVDPTEAPPIVGPLALVLPAVLAAMIIGRLAVAFGLIRSAPSGPWLGAVAALSVITICVAQLSPAPSWPPGNPTHYLPVFFLGGLVGTVFGLIPAVVSLGLLVPALLLLRLDISPAGAQALVTVVPAIVTAMFAVLIVGPGADGAIIVRMGAALAGTGAALSAGWILE